MKPVTSFPQSRAQILLASIFFLLTSLSQVFLAFSFEELPPQLQIFTLLVGPFIFLSFGFAGLTGFSSALRGGRALVIFEDGFEDQTLLRRRGWRVSWEQVDRIVAHKERLEIVLKDRDSAIEVLPKWQRTWLKIALGQEQSLLLDAQFLKAEYSDLKLAILESWQSFQQRS